jgi:hypothetical protein
MVIALLGVMGECLSLIFDLFCLVNTNALMDSKTHTVVKDKLGRRFNEFEFGIELWVLKRKREGARE